MFPLKDNIPTERFPVVTVGLIALNILVFVYTLTLSQVQLDTFFTTYGMIPYEISHHVSRFDHAGLPVYATIFTSMFVHDGWLHIGGNMLFLWIFGNNVEDSMGRGRFVIFYFMCGLVATIAQIAVDPNSMVPNIGASGAIAGVLGAYLLLFPRARVITYIVPFFFVELPAIIVLVFWIILQVISGTLDLSAGQAGGGVAYFAHIGGFAAGLLTIRLFTIHTSLVHQKRRHM